MESVKSYFSTHNLKEAWEIDKTETLGDVGNFIEETGEAIFMGLAMGLAYVAIPPMILGAIYTPKLREHGAQREKRFAEERDLYHSLSLRKKFNYNIQKQGNQVTPKKITKLTRYGLGDLLTEDITFEKTGGSIGAVIGATAPIFLIYKRSHSIPMTVLGTTIIAPVLGLSTALGGTIGADLGKRLDNLLSSNNKPEAEKK